MLISASISVVLVTATVAPEFSVELVVISEAVDEVEEVDAGAAVPARAAWWRGAGSSLAVPLSLCRPTRVGLYNAYSKVI